MVNKLHIKYNNSSIQRIGKISAEEKMRESKQIEFIVRSHFSKTTEKKYLGYLWLILDPLVTSLIYLFVFTVVRARIGPGSIFIGITLYKVLESSIKAGINIVKQNDGGIKCERIGSAIILKATILRRSIESILGTVPTSLILIFGFGIDWQGGIFYILIAQIMSLLFLGLGLCAAGIVRKIPDIGEVVNWILRIGFFISPAIYPMYKMQGLHYKVNEFNPFTYFAEGTRKIAGETSMFDKLSPSIMFSLLAIIVLLNVWAIRRFDKLRWRITVWS